MDVFPTAYFPSINYLKELLKCVRPEIEIHEHFPKQTIRNRCEILTGNGVLVLSVPIIHSHGAKQTTGEIRIDYSSNWQADHWRAIESAYTSAPYFEDYFTEVKSLIFVKHEYLLAKNEAILAFISSVLDKEIHVKKSTSFLKMVPSNKNLYLEKITEANEKKYQQVFSYKNPFTSNLSILDLIFNEGPFCRNWILSSKD